MLLHMFIHVHTACTHVFCEYVRVRERVYMFLYIRRVDACVGLPSVSLSLSAYLYSRVYAYHAKPCRHTYLSIYPSICFFIYLSISTERPRSLYYVESCREFARRRVFAVPLADARSHVRLSPSGCVASSFGEVSHTLCDRGECSRSIGLHQFVTAAWHQKHDRLRGGGTSALACRDRRGWTRRELG